MGNAKTKKWFGILLTTVLSLQLSYHTLHVLTSHVLSSCDHHSVHDTQIEELSFSCELCAKLLGQTVYLWFCTLILLGFVAAFAIISIQDLYFRPRTLAIRSLRGPPTPIFQRYSCCSRHLS